MRITRLLGVATLAVASLSSTAAFAQSPAETVQPLRIAIAVYVTEAAQRFGLPEHWIYAVMRTESAGRIGAVSSAGAMGLMQLMPGTWARQRARFGLGADPFDPRDNIMAGTSYLREMYDSYGAPGFLAAYNAGPGRYEAWRGRGRPLPIETRAYVAAIAPLLQSGTAATMLATAAPMQPARASWTQSELFAARGATEIDAPESPAARPDPAPTSPTIRPRNGLFAAVSASRSQ